MRSLHLAAGRTDTTADAPRTRRTTGATRLTT